MKKMGIALGCAALLLSACANRVGTYWVPQDFRPTHPQTKDVFSPAKGEQATAAIGTSLVTAGRVSFRQAIRVTGPVFAESAAVEGETFRYHLPGGVYRHTYNNHQGDRFFTIGPGKLVWHYKGKDGRPDDAMLYFHLTQSGQLLVSGLYPEDDHLMTATVRDPQFELIQTEEQDDLSLKRELIYTGRAGNSLTLLYREFINDMARPAFSQQLQYDIGTDPVIGYQGARFRVLATDNTGITYEVLETLAPR